MTTATTIYQQLGGNKFKAMTGAKNFSTSGPDLKFRLPGKPGFVRQGINLVQIRHNSLDLYDMTFSRITIRKGNLKIKDIAEIPGIYADQLQKIFTETTGLNTRLF